MKTNARLLAFFSLAGVAATLAQAPAAPKPPAPKQTNSAVYDWNNLKAETRPNGERRPVFDSPTETLANFECHITTLKAGENSGPAHTHTVEEATFVKEGTVEIQINETRQTIGPGSVFYFAAKDSVAIKNVGPGPATYVVFSIRAQPAAPGKN
jgi:mannose-6-phosphate isomerase-like protein (cupin superfamily)